jgi:hypothetical protein
LRLGVRGFATAGNTMDQIIVADNTFRMLTQDDSHTIDFATGVDNTAFLGSLAIEKNSIWSAEADASASGIYAAALFDVIHIEANKLRHLSGPGIEIGSLNASSSLSITDNSVIDCGRTSNATYKKGHQGSGRIDSKIDQDWPQHHHKQRDRVYDNRHQREPYERRRRQLGL